MYWLLICNEHYQITLPIIFLGFLFEVYLIKNKSRILMTLLRRVYI